MLRIDGYLRSRTCRELVTRHVISYLKPRYRSARNFTPVFWVYKVAARLNLSL
jgi:hypothetical protein